VKRFNNKYRIPSARLANYDYSNNGDYFITICTSGRMQYFGKIKKDKMILSEMGLIVGNLIPDITKKFQDIRIVENIIMPDHIHFIIKINKPNIEIPVETRLTAFLQLEQEIKGGITGTNNPMSKNGIPKIVRWFKGRATFELRKINKEFAWQARYYDRIIRNKDEYFATIQYIKSNPANWDDGL
jgi:REP element-mobilizing transposase RayT